MARDAAAGSPRSAVERHLLAKTLAGFVGGFGLAVAASALLILLAPGGLSAPGKFQVAMWAVPPVWIAVAAAAPLFRSGPRAVLVLAVANVAAGALVVLCRYAALR